jgi:protein-S-isoprenylcysteine O-methyltransferase Ste14
MSSIGDAWRILIPALWLVWIVGWCLAAIGTKRTRWRESWRDAVANRLPVFLGMFLMMTPRGPLGLLVWRVVPPGTLAPISGVVLTAAGLLFTVWARVHLGGNWSGNVTVKEGHTLVTNGPYRWVRHPIYTGLFLAMIGTALAVGTARAFVGAGLILLGFIIKLQVEEARMRETFPADYAEYSRSTARLIPGLY